MLRGLVSATCVLVIGTRWGGVPDIAAALLAYPALALGGVCFACCGLAATGHARSWEFFAYFFTCWVTPMFVFSGTFFEVERFPWFIQSVAWLLPARSEEHTSELQSLMRISYAVFCLKKKKYNTQNTRVYANRQNRYQP